MYGPWAPPRSGPSSQSSPSHARSSIACPRAPSFTRGESMSSIRRISFPPAWRAASQANKYVRALPRCCAPVGEGASRPTGGAAAREASSAAAVSSSAGGSRRLEIGIPRVTRKRNHIANVGHPGDVLDRSLQPQPKTGVGYGAETPQIELPPVFLLIEPRLRHPPLQHIEAFLTLASADDFSDPR